LELTALPSIDKKAWIPSVQEANALLFWGGDPVPVCAIDDEIAIKVVDGHVEVVSEDHWKLFTHPIVA
jgi:dipeptidase E